MSVSQKVLRHASDLGLKELTPLTSRRGQTTFRARDVHNGQVVLKLVSLLDDPPSEGYSPALCLQNEIAILSKLKDSITPYVRGGGKSGDLLWLLMEALPGESSAHVAERIRAASDVDAARRDMLALWLQMAKALQQLHEQGIVHGDMQPAHFQVDTTDGQVFLLDFGLSAPPGELPFPYLGAMIHFNAPETAAALLSRSEVGSPDVPSEVYSFGAVLSYLYTGELPVDYTIPTQGEATREEMLSAIAAGRRAPLREGLLLRYAPIDRVLDRMLAIDRNKRHRSIAEFTAEIEEILKVL